MGKLLTWSRIYLLVSCIVWYTLGRLDTFNHLHALWDVLLFILILGIHFFVILVHDFLQWCEGEQSWMEIEELHRQRLRVVHEDQDTETRDTGVDGVEVLPWEESSHVQVQAGEEAGPGAT